MNWLMWSNKPCEISFKK